MELENGEQRQTVTQEIDIAFAPLNAVRCALSESPVWDARRGALWYCDIQARTIFRHTMASGAVDRWTFPSEVGSLGLAASGRLVVALRHTVGLFDPDTGAFEAIAEIEADRDRATRLNDGKIGPDGAFWVGTMDDRSLAEREALGSLYRVTPEGGVEKKSDGMIVSNGLAWSADGRTMFHSDSTAAWLDRWDFDPRTGTISGRTRIATFDNAKGRPDGGATDADGFYWSAGVSSQHLNRIDRDGTVVATCAVPVGAPTMPCFGGPDLRTLFVTNLRRGRPAELIDRYPLSGLVITGTSPVAGAPVGLFRDR